MSARGNLLLGGVAAAGLSAAAMERRHLRRIASDPENELLRNPPHGRELRVGSADGTNLHVEEFGPQEGPTVVLAHGWTEAIPFWTFVIGELNERGLRVVAYDQRGHGKSDPASGGDYSIARFGEDLEAVLDRVLREDQRAVVAGHSLGAMSIVAWAAEHDVQRRATAAALLNTGVGDLLAEHLLVPLPWLAHVLNRVLPPTKFVGARAPLPRFSTPISNLAAKYVAFGRSASPARVAFFERMLVGCPPDVRADVGIALSELELHHALPRLAVPTTVIAGAQDRLTPPSHAKRIAEQLPRLERLIVLPETGHMAPLERPSEVSKAIAELAVARGSAGSAVAA
jgi:pimeloyl-ACP methyl ester carboxylesterase